VRVQSASRLRQVGDVSPDPAGQLSFVHKLRFFMRRPDSSRGDVAGSGKIGDLVEDSRQRPHVLCT
jgi:hypothetical protein